MSEYECSKCKKTTHAYALYAIPVSYGLEVLVCSDCLKKMVVKEHLDEESELKEETGDYY